MGCVPRTRSDEIINNDDPASLLDTPYLNLYLVLFVMREGNEVCLDNFWSIITSSPFRTPNRISQRQFCREACLMRDEQGSRVVRLGHMLCGPLADSSPFFRTGTKAQPSSSATKGPKRKPRESYEVITKVMD